ncbi:dolichyl-diphosphooligosaccharide---protein glycosyltransferase [Nematocida major]|uniref:dolichyl-diphosphooligosaccharide---protein glycosyltransferase n=1 Tax=Nematocida major TaxID=1912982 RepID=UPI002008478F|nr:dolichyl-diphosphooligosaccharide---protein glycosyltransferase [Nematocida major]KAH9386072.1 dolichyl-diphosphooligosaccharide---protein glycosyltransferase [Nematocida major]
MGHACLQVSDYALRRVQCVAVLLVVYTLLLRIWPSARYGILINEFDPWFNYRCSKYMWAHGITEYFRWKDPSTWVPVGRDIPKTAYPFLFILSYCANSVLGVFARVSHYTVCCMSSPALFLACMCVMWTMCMGLFEGPGQRIKAYVALSLFSMSGGLFEKTMAGAYDYEALSLFLALAVACTYTLYIKAVDGRRWHRCLLGAGITFLQCVFNATWGGSVFTDALVYGHSMLTLGSWRLLLGNALVTTGFDHACPFLWGLRPVNILKIAIACSLPILRGFLHGSRRTKAAYVFGFGLAAAGLAICMLKMSMHTRLEKILKGKDKLYNVFIRQKMHPLVASITEHRAPDVWQASRLCGPFACLAPFFVAWSAYSASTAAAGKRRNLRLFLVCGLVFSSLIFMRMERFAFLLAPFLSLAVSDAFCEIMFLRPAARHGKLSAARIFKSAARLGFAALMFLHVASSIRTIQRMAKHVIVVAEGSSKSKPVLVDDFREAAVFMKHNVDPSSVVVSWWDYGYQITGMSGLSTVIDNNTNNYERISETADFLVSPEHTISKAHPLIRKIAPDSRTSVYIYTVCGYLSKYNLSDLNKLVWITRIAQETNRSVAPRAYHYRCKGKTLYSLHQMGDLDISAETLGGHPLHISTAMKESLLFKLAFYLYTDKIKLTNIELAYQSSNHIVRLYKIVG